MARVIETQTKVVAVTPGKIWVATDPQGCTACQKPCGLSTLGKLSALSQLVPIHCDVPIAVGEEVKLTSTEGDLFQAGLLAYMMPATFTVGGAGLATVLEGSDLSAILGALMGFILGLFLMYLLGRQTQRLQVTQESISLGERS